MTYELSGVEIGILKMTNFNYFSIERELMVTADDMLIFGSGQKVFAFGK
jgi:hypothetical protein